MHWLGILSHLSYMSYRRDYPEIWERGGGLVSKKFHFFAIVIFFLLHVITIAISFLRVELLPIVFLWISHTVMYYQIQMLLFQDFQDTNDNKIKISSIWIKFFQHHAKLYHDSSARYMRGRRDTPQMIWQKHSYEYHPNFQFCQYTIFLSTHDTKWNICRYYFYSAFCHPQCLTGHSNIRKC